MLRSQRGNNNAYCQDNEVSWFDWQLLDRHADVHRFVKTVLAYRQHRDAATMDSPVSLNDLLHQAAIEWHGVALGAPDWGDHSHSIAFTARSFHARFMVHAICNAYREPLTFALPPVPAGQQPWRRCMDTGRAAPDDVRPFAEAPVMDQAGYEAGPRSIVLFARLLPQPE
jgi:isoamylase